MNATKQFRRYQSLQKYVGWEESDAERMRSVGRQLNLYFIPLIEDFYDEIDRHPDAKKVITGGAEQIARLKMTLRAWLEQLFSGRYDAEFVASRFRVGARHVEIGLEQVYTNVALSRMRQSLSRTLIEHWSADGESLRATLDSLNKLLDLDLAIIEDAYQDEYTARQQRIERLATIGQVAGGIAHELRNPLNAMRMSVYYLTNAKSASSEKQAEHLKRIDRQVGIADGVITALSDFSKMPIPDLKPVPLRDGIEEVLELTSLPKNIDVAILCPEDLPPVMADANQLQIVLGNLIRNARDAMPEGGLLRFSAGQTGDYIELSIADNGVGISPEQVHLIMEPLYSTKARGIGLGLAITRAILEKHNGGLRVESKQGQGSILTLWLRPAPATS